MILAALAAGLVGTALTGGGSLSLDAGVAVALISGTIGGLASSTRWVGIGFHRPEGPDPDGANSPAIAARWRTVAADLGAAALFGTIGVAVVTAYVMAQDGGQSMVGALLPTVFLQFLWTLTYVGGLFLPGLVWVPVAVLIRAARLRGSGTPLHGAWYLLVGFVLLADVTIAVLIAVILLVPSVPGANTSRHFMPAAGVDLSTLDPGRVALVMTANALMLVWAVLVLTVITARWWWPRLRKRRAARTQPRDPS